MQGEDPPVIGGESPAVGQHLAKGRGLREKGIGPVLDPLNSYVLIAEVGEHNNRRSGELGVIMAADRAAHRPAIQDRQHEIEQNTVGPDGLDHSAAFATVTRNLGLEAPALQTVGQEIGDVLLVLDNKDRWEICGLSDRENGLDFHGFF